MRRFFIGSAVAALMGLLLAGGAYWAYWHFHARFLPVTINRNQTQIQRLLDEASWVSDGGGGQPVYVISYRDSGAAQAYERQEAAKLRAAGVEVRYIVFARADREGLAQSTAAERATVAELWLSRDWTLHQRWMATPSRSWTAAGIPHADGNLARSGVVDAGRQFDEQLSLLLKRAGVRVTYPLILWRDREGFLKACGCADRRAWAFVRDDLNAPDRAARTEGEDAIAPSDDTTTQIAPTAPATPSDDGALPYPKLSPPPAAVAPSEPEAPYPLAPPQPLPDPFAQPAPRTPAPQPQQARPPTRPAPSAQQAAPSQPRPRAPATHRNAPQARKQDDATFY
nr:hypothetical protein [uncultured Brevundimonas sp.]